MTLWTPTKQPRNSRLLNPRLSSDTERLNWWMRQGWTLHYVYDARVKEITRGEYTVEGDEGGVEWIRYCYYPSERRKFCSSFYPSFCVLSPHLNAATNSSLTRLRNKLARKFELFQVGQKREEQISVAKEKRGLKEGKDEVRRKYKMRLDIKKQGYFAP